MRLNAFASLAIAASITGCAGTPIAYPAAECGTKAAPEPGKAVETDCVARLFVPTPQVVAKAHTPDARAQQAITPTQTPDAPMTAALPAVCVPRYNLELWDVGRRKQSESDCGLPEGTLAPVGRYFDCVQTREDRCDRPAIGVALEGGGTKSAPFSLGVLAGLNDSRVLPAVDLVGSASGGSYAAYFYFARLVEREKVADARESGPDDWFRDCMPSLYRRRGVVPMALLPDSEFCKELEEATGVFHKLVEDNEFERRFPYQYQAKVGRDLLSLHQSLRLREESPNFRDLAPAALGVSFLAVEHAATVIPHLFTNALFDWPANYSPSREAYRAGIERAYGYSARDWREALREEDFAFTEPPRDGRWIGTRFARPWKMSDLEDAYVGAHRRCLSVREPCGFPLWVLSTVSSAGRSHDFWVRPQPRDFQRFSFELSPRGHGSGLLGFLDVAPDLQLRNAVGASAAFLDDQQRAIAENIVLRTLASAFIFFGNLNWGTNIANFNTSDEKRAGTALTPFPGYWLPYFQGLRAGHIHLADGGNVDNLGLVPLLRRGVRNIVVSASTEDRFGEFPSLCKVKNDLELEIATDRNGVRDAQSVYDVLMPGLEAFDKVCNRQLGKQELEVWGRDTVKALVCRRLPEEQCDDALLDRVLRRKTSVVGYDFWNWPTPVVEGCVVRRKNPKVVATDNGTCDDARNEKREVSHLYIIKPALSGPRDYLKQMQGEAIRGCTWNNDGSVRGDPLALGALPKGMDLPCSALAYVSSVPPRYERCDKAHHTFPQDEFIGMTVHSAYTLYGAYYDLGRHRSAQLTRCGDGLCVAHPQPAASPIPVCRAKG